jgi:hypothetical protein
MDKQAMHRYKVWLLAKEKAGLGNPDTGQNLGRSSKQVNKLTDLETLLLLYNYGRPMDLAVESKFTLPSGESAACKTKKVSSESIDCVFNAPSSEATTTARPVMPVGSAVSLDLDEVGACGGVLTSHNEAGFRVAVNKENRSAVSTKLAHIAVKRGIGVDATSTLKTGVPRIEPANKNCAFTDHTGMLRTGTIVNLSQFDALIRASATIIPPMGTRIVLRGPVWHGADVISTFEIGFMVKFCLPIPNDQFSAALRFTDA